MKQSVKRRRKEARDAVLAVPEFAADTMAAKIFMKALEDEAARERLLKEHSLAFMKALREELAIVEAEKREKEKLGREGDIKEADKRRNAISSKIEDAFKRKIMQKEVAFAEEKEKERMNMKAKRRSKL